MSDENPELAVFLERIRAAMTFEAAALAYAGAIRRQRRKRLPRHSPMWRPLNDALAEKWGRSTMNYVKGRAADILDAEDAAR